MQKQDKPWYEGSQFSAAKWFFEKVFPVAGAFICIAPNVITLIGGALALPMCVAFYFDAYLVGTTFFAFGLLADLLDGALAHHQEQHLPDIAYKNAKRSEWTRLGKSRYGKVLDPVMDKVRYFPALFLLGWQVLPQILIWLALGIAVLLTVFRPLAWKLWGIVPEANRLGKAKLVIESTVIFMLALQASGVLLAMPLHEMFIAATALGGGSLALQIRSALRQG